MVAAIRRSLGAPTQYSNQMLRRQLAFWMVQNAELLCDQVMVELMLNYGELVDQKNRRKSQSGPYSYASYCRSLMKAAEYGDTLMISLFAWMWSLKITVVSAPEEVLHQPITEMRFHHDCPLPKADVVLVYNGHNHYSCAGELKLF